jgi:predicted phage tail protein
VAVSGAFRSDAADYAYPAITVTWTPSNDPQRKHFEIQWGQAGNFTGTHFETGSQWINRSVTVGQAYDVRIRSVRLSDTTSDWVTVTNTTVENDITPPGPPTNLSVTAGSGSGGGGGGPGNPDTIFWRTPTDLDILRSRVYANSTNDPATATAFAEVFGLPGTNYSTTHPHNTSGTFYWVESVDRVGNTSARTFAGTA